MTPSTYNPFVFNSWSCWPRYPRIIHRLVFAESHCNNKLINLACVNRSITENVLHQKVTVSSFACQFWKTFFHCCVDHVHLLWMSQNQAWISPMLIAPGWFRPGSGTSWLVCTGSGLLWHVHIRISAISASVSGSSESGVAHAVLHWTRGWWRHASRPGCWSASVCGLCHWSGPRLVPYPFYLVTWLVPSPVAMVTCKHGRPVLLACSTFEPRVVNQTGADWLNTDFTKSIVWTAAPKLKNLHLLKIGYDAWLVLNFVWMSRSLCCHGIYMILTRGHDRKMSKKKKYVYVSRFDLCALGIYNEPHNIPT